MAVFDTDSKEFELIKQIYQNRLIIKEAELKIDELRDELGVLDEEPTVAGIFKVNVTTSRRFDPAKAKEILSDEEYKKILVEKPDSKLAKTLFEKHYEWMTRPDSKQTIKIELMQDDY